MTFKQALRKMPRCINGFDPLVHTRIEDLAFLAQHELDLYIEGEPNDIRNQKELSSTKRYFQLLSGNEYRWMDP